MRTIALLLFAIGLLLVANPIYAQTRFTTGQIDPANKNPIRLRDIANRPCISIKGAIRTETINTAIVDQFVIAENICPKIIQIKACYSGTTRCVEFPVRSRERKEVLFGTTTASSVTPALFRFDFTEKSLF